MPAVPTLDQPKPGNGPRLITAADRLGRYTVGRLDQVGFAAMLLLESVTLLVSGRAQQQPVRVAAVVQQMMTVGILAIPIVTLLAATIGVMLAIQSVYSLGLFGAESYAYVGIGLSVTREFAPLIIGILIAGRSGSALAARLATMTMNQEIDALRVIGISPVRFVVIPALVALFVMVPALTVWANVIALWMAGLFLASALDSTVIAFAYDVVSVLSVNDVLHGLGKSSLFALLIALIAAANGAAATGGAEGVGRATTSTVVQSISAIVVTDMLFAFLVTA